MSCDPQELMGEAKCLDCLSGKQLEMVKTWILCQLLTVGGGALQQVFGGSGEPPSALIPVASYAIWINTDDESLRTWHDGAWH